MTRARYLHPAAVPLPVREQVAGMIRFAVRATGLDWLTPCLRVAWYVPIGGEGGEEPAAAFAMQAGAWGFVMRKDPTLIHLRADLLLDAILLTAAHEIYHVAEYLHGIPREDEAGRQRSEAEAEAFARRAFLLLRGRGPVLCWRRRA